MNSTTKRLLINEWLTSTDDALRELKFDDTQMRTLFEFLENHLDSDLELLKSITKKLYEIYQTGDARLRLLTFCFIPSLIAIYIRVVHNYYHLQKAEFHSLAILLLAVYNCEIMEPSPEAADSGRLKTADVRVVSLAKPSIYHEPSVHTQSSTSVNLPTEQTLAKMNNPAESRIAIFGPYEEVEQLVAANYATVCMVLLKVYNHHISEMGVVSHFALCRLYLRLLKQGTNIDIKEKIREFLSESMAHQAAVAYQTSQTAEAAKVHHHHHTKSHLTYQSSLVLPRNSVQIQFASPFLVELTRSIYYCIYNDTDADTDRELSQTAFEVLEQIARRATIKLYGDVLLMVNAIRNTIAIKTDRERSTEGVIEVVANPIKAQNGNAGHATSLSSLTSLPGESKWTNVRRTAITTASFKTRKLPDDIPIITGNPTTGTGPQTPGAQPGVTPLKSTPPAGNQSTPAQNPPSSSHHHGRDAHLALMLQNSKNLDSIDEESGERLLANGDSPGGVTPVGKGASSSAVAVSAKKTSKKNPVMNLLKELKDSKPKLPKMGSGKENGKLANSNSVVSNSTTTTTTHSNSGNNLNLSRDRDSDTSALSDTGCTRLSLGDGEDGDAIPLRRLNRFIDDDSDGAVDDEADCAVELGGDDLDEFNGNGAGADTRNGGGGGDDDDGSTSDRSGNSSKGLLANTKKATGNDSKSPPGVKLSVP